MEYVIVVLKAAALFIAVLIGFRIMGNQAVGRLTAFDLVVVIALGALMGAPLADDSLRLSIALTGVATLVFVQRLTAFLALKSRWFAKMAIGSPIKIIDQGKIDEKGLKEARLTYDNLIEELRLKGLTRVSDVEVGYLEPEGQMSVILKKKKQPLTKEDKQQMKNRLKD